MLEIYNPATDRHLVSLEEDTAESLKAKFHKAKEAQVNWAKTPLKKRLAAIEKFKHLIT